MKFTHNDLETTCPKCNGKGTVEKDDFERDVERAMDTQGLSYNDAYNQAKRRYHGEIEEYCIICNKTGKVPSETGQAIIDFLNKYHQK